MTRLFINLFTNAKNVPKASDLRGYKTFNEAAQGFFFYLLFLAVFLTIKFFMLIFTLKRSVLNA